MSYNKVSFLATLSAAVEALGIAKKSVTISHGGASLMLGLREATNDIDVQLTSSVFDILAKTHPVKVLGALGWNGEQQVIEFQGVDFHRCPVGTIIFPYSWKDSVDGFDVTGQLQLLVDRIKLGRRKDLDDIYHLRSLWRSLPDQYKDRLSHLLDTVGVSNVET